MTRRATAIGALRFDNSFSRLPDAFGTRLPPQGLPAPYLVAASDACCELLGLEPEALATDEALTVFSGNRVLEQMAPVAMAYAGHQFGAYNPQLGDGRALLLGEVVTDDGRRLDLQLKGSGRTPYSRFGDGRAVLRSSIREFLGSEAMAALGIPTTRALCIVGSDMPVCRETTETAAIVTRVADTHIRFGQFEYFHYTGRPELVRMLADHVIEHYLASLAQLDDPYAGLFDYAVHRTAELVAHWQAVGFAHGVLNTDNMSILGHTLDFGPFGFLDDYEPGLICNHSDHTGRYAFNRQPAIALWNLKALAQPFASLTDAGRLDELLGGYEPYLVERYTALMQAKLGLRQAHDDDRALIRDWLELLGNARADYTVAFRRLCDFDGPAGNAGLQMLFDDTAAFERFSARYHARLAAETSDGHARTARMRRVNPKYVLRNYLAQQAIEQAQSGDFSEVRRLVEVLAAPYDEQPAFDAYAAPAPEWGKRLSVSCSS